MELELAIVKRRSCRRFEKTPVSDDQINQLVWAGQGETAPGKRTAPSAGGIDPIDIFFICNVIICEIEAPLAMILTAEFDRVKRRYGRRAKRYVYIEAGHIAQNISLMAVSLGLSSVCIGAFNARQIKERFSLWDIPIYIVLVGYEKRTCKGCEFRDDCMGGGEVGGCRKYPDGPYLDF